MRVVLLSRVAESKGGKNGLQSEYFKGKILIFYTSTDFKHESNKGKLKNIFFSNFYLFNYKYIFIYFYFLLAAPYYQDFKYFL